jgi:formate hydrogenlyase transcriptional activator
MNDASWGDEKNIESAAHGVRHPPTSPSQPINSPPHGDQYRALLAVSDALMSHRDLSALFHDLAGRLRQVVEFEFLVLHLHDAVNNTMRLCFQEESHPNPPPPGTSFPVEGSPPGWVWQTQQALVVPNVAEETRWPWFIAHLPRKIGINSFCDLPLTTARSRLGTLAFGSKRLAAYDPADVEFMQQVANQVALAVENALAFREIAELKDKLAQEKVYLEEEIRTEHNFDEIVGQSTALRLILKQAETVAPTDSTVLIRGETGTGKELIARAIHHRSARRERTFVKFNCAAIPMGLLESELFGHERGAFTGAIAQKIGRFELAHQGTLFLDEVGDIPLELQPKLLRVLQEQEFERLGSPRTIQVNVRLVAATNRDLLQMVAEGQFRKDLYYRLNVFPVVLPPLRERREDIPRLVRHFVLKFAKRMGRRIETIPGEVMTALTAYSWPGNIRELENLIERAVILSPADVLLVPVSELKAGAELGQIPASADGTLVNAEREHILHALREAKWILGGPNGAAARLGMKRSTLHWKMKKLGIYRPA